ncbi:MAG TPA: hypothetical protein VNP04_00355 [Alphaproteobacteria bacterium]|nr:hypothetical protein [Alphaproteobacteria bacterium]
MNAATTQQGELAPYRQPVDAALAVLGTDACLGLSALLDPLTVSVRTICFGLPATIVAALALMAMAWDGILTRIDGAVLVDSALVYTVMIVRLARHERRAVQAEFARKVRRAA